MVNHNAVMAILILLLLLCGASTANCATKFQVTTICANFTITNETVLSSATKLLKLDNITGEISYENIATLANISEITIKRSDLTSGLEIFCKITQLASINILDGTKLPPHITQDSFKECKSLKKLNLNGATEIDKDAFVELDRLESLTLNATKFPNDSITASHFSGLHLLKSLTIRNSRIAKITPPADLSADLKKLQYLDLQSTQLTAIPEEMLRQLTGLKVLDLSGNKIGQITGKDEFKGATSLKVLFLERNPLEIVDAELLKQNLPNLERVFFTYANLNDASKRSIDEFLIRHKNISVIYV